MTRTQLPESGVGSKGFAPGCGAPGKSGVVGSGIAVGGVEGGKVTGLVVSAKDDGTMLSAAGLQKGDVIISVNGRPVSAAAELAAQLRSGARLTLEIERGAQKLPVALILEQ